MNIKRLIIIADGNLTIGAGHLSRCLTIGRAAKKRGIDPLFILSDKVSLEYLQRLSEGVKYTYRIVSRDDFLKEILRGAKADFAKNPGVSKEESLREVIGRAEEAAVLVDSYEVSGDFFEKLLSAGFQRVSRIDDLHEEAYPGVLIIDYDKDLSLAPIREGFAEFPFEVRESGKRILFSSGSGDPMGLFEQLLRISKERYPEVELQVLRGIAPSEMPKFIAGFDVGIFAAGGSLYEAAALGLPLLSFSFVENQVAGGKAMEQAGIRYLGDCREDREAAGPVDEFLERALREAVKLLEDLEERKRISLHEKTLIDGKGTERILGLL